MRVGFFPITGDPIHYGHLTGAIRVLRACSLATVFIQVCGDLPQHKPQKASKWHRHQMAKLAIREFGPLIQYTPLGFEEDLVGEDLFVEFVQDPSFHAVTQFYYVAGIDNRDIVLERFSKNKDRLHVRYRIVFLSRKGYHSQQSSSDYLTVDYESDLSSSLFRDKGQTDAVPEAVLRYCQEHHLYGH
jgi:nicotinic acid mononucleotide adenylyltransferase